MRSTTSIGAIAFLLSTALFLSSISFVGAETACTFDRTLSRGDRGADVSCLQQMLIEKGYLTSDNATGFFGVLTEGAVKQFQSANGLEPVGWAGRLTRASLFGAVQQTTTTSCFLSRSLFRGERGSEVLCLQRFLVDRGYLTSDNATGFFGSLTESAVKQFQSANGLESVGWVGKLTRTAVNNGTINHSDTSSASSTSGISCNESGVLIPNGASRSFYSNSSAVSPSTCAGISQMRSCENGVLNGSPVYRFSTCSITGIQAVDTPIGGGNATANNVGGTSVNIGTPPDPEAWRFPAHHDSIKPVVFYQGTQVAPTNKNAQGGVITWDIKEGGSNRTLGTIQIVGTSTNKIAISLHAVVGGTFRYGASLETPSMQILDIAHTMIAAGSTQQTRYYPYNWTLRVTPTSLEDDPGADADFAVPDLITPGFGVNCTGPVQCATYYAYDTSRLTSVSFSGNGSSAVATFLRYREQNTGHDLATPDVILAADSTDSFAVVAATSYQSLLDAKFGRPNTTSGRFTTFAYQGWPCSSVACSPSESQYTQFAARLKGAFDAVIIRSYTPSSVAADAFNANGVDPYLYIYPAVRRTTQGFVGPKAGFDSSWLMRDTNGNYHTAPFAETPSRLAPWGLLDVRKPAARAYLVGIAVDAVRMGYKGVYFDSPAFFSASDGYVGGGSDVESMSWQYGRTLLMQETKAAIREVNPSARVGVLGNTFTDGQHVADWNLKEGYSSAWVSLDTNPLEHVLRYSVPNSLWSEGYRPFLNAAGGTVIVGQKGSNPLLISLGLAQAGAQSGTWYTDNSQLPNASSFSAIGALGDILSAVSSYGRTSTASQILSVNPSTARVYGHGPSVLSVSTNASLALSANSPMLNLQTLQITESNTHSLVTSNRYIIAERRTSSGAWSWTGYGFAYSNASNYVYGDAYFIAPPSGGGRTKITFQVRTSPGPLVSGNTPSHNGVFTKNTLTFRLTNEPLEVHIIDVLGNVTTVNPDFVDHKLSVTLPDSNFSKYTIELVYSL